MREKFIQLLTAFKWLFIIGSFLGLIPIIMLVIWLRGRLDLPASLFIKLLFLFLGLIVIFIIIKIIKRIFFKEKGVDLTTDHITDLGLFSGFTNRQIIMGLGILTAILLIALLPGPFKIFILFAGFYMLFTVIGHWS